MPMMWKNEHGKMISYFMLSSKLVEENIIAVDYLSKLSVRRVICSGTSEFVVISKFSI